MGTADCTCSNCIAGGYTYTEEWRMRCELRMVWRMTQDRRNGYYALVAKHRGQASANRIRQAIEDEEARRK